VQCLTLLIPGLLRKKYWFLILWTVWGWTTSSQQHCVKYCKIACIGHVAEHMSSEAGMHKQVHNKCWLYHSKRMRAAFHRCATWVIVRCMRYGYLLFTNRWDSVVLLTTNNWKINLLWKKPHAKIIELSLSLWQSGKQVEYPQQTLASVDKHHGKHSKT